MLQLMVDLRKKTLFKAALWTFILPGIWGITSIPFLVLGKRVEGSVIAMTYNPGAKFKNQNSRPYWSRVVQFSTEEGQVLKYEAVDNSVFIGDRVEVYYLPGTSLARLASFNEFWWLLVYTLCVQGFLLIVLGMIACFLSRNAKFNFIAPFGLPLLCLYIVVLSAYPGYQTARILNQGVQTTGVIVLEPVSAPKGKHYPVVQFVAGNGQTYKMESQSYNKGANVKVVYLPQHPQSALVLNGIDDVESIQQWWLLPLLFMGLPTLFSLVFALLCILPCEDEFGN